LIERKSQSLLCLLVPRRKFLICLLGCRDQKNNLNLQQNYELMSFSYYHNNPKCLKRFNEVFIFSKKIIQVKRLLCSQFFIEWKSLKKITSMPWYFNYISSMEAMHELMPDTLTQISVLLAQILLPINIFLGITGNLANIFVLTRPRLIQYASSHYFLAMAINNLIGSGFISTINLLSMAYKIDISLFSSVSCKLVRYFSDLCIILSSYFIVLASIDRFCASSRSATIRKLSSIKVARIMISGLVLTFSVLYINTLVLIEIIAIDRLGCVIRSQSLYHQIYSIAQVFIYSILSSCLMILFGFLTIYHTKKMRVQPTNVVTYRRTERQLTMMLLVQVAMHLILNLPISILYLMMQFLPDDAFTTTFYFILILSRYLCDFSFSTPFFLYIASGQVFQAELIHMIKRFFPCLHF